MSSISLLLHGVAMLLAGLLLAVAVGVHVVARCLGDLRDRDAPLARQRHG